MLNNNQDIDNQQIPEMSKPKIRLPFERRKTDIGMWFYKHRIGICVTVLVYISAALFFVWASVTLDGRAMADTILIDFHEPETEREKEKEEVRQRLEELARQTELGKVKNLASNEMSEKTTPTTNESRIYDQAQALEESMRANREAYESGLRAEREMASNRRSQSADNRAEADETPSDAKVEGNVTVSYSFSKPVRLSTKLVVPAYMCKGAGKVVVQAVLNNNGDVVWAEADRAKSTTDDCMLTAARNAAMSSRFNLDKTAAAKHRGVITYVFVAQ